MNLKTGYIGARKGSKYGPAPLLARTLLMPYTDRHHFFILGDYIEDEDDWVILESIAKGVAVGRLSWYDKSELEFYRPFQFTEEMGKKAAQQSTRYGRCGYGYLLYLAMIRYGLKALFWNIIRYRWFHIYYTDIPNIENRSLICTELVNNAYKGLARIFDDRYEATPSNFEQQVKLGFIEKV